MASGFKIADAYVEAHLDRDRLRSDIAGLPAEMNSDVDRGGRDIGQRLGRGIGDGATAGFQQSGAPKIANAVEQLSARLEKARRAEKTATDAVQLSELRLSEARDKGNVVGSRMLALEQSVEHARARSTDATVTRVAVERQLATVMSDAERAVGPDAQRSGGDAGNKLSQGFQLAMVRNSPVIAAAIAGALTFGTPTAVAGVATVFTAIAAAAVAGNKQVSTQFIKLGETATDMIQQAATVAIPFFLQSIHRLSAGVQALQPQFHAAFASLGPSIDNLTSGVLGFVHNAMPGMVRAIQNAQPIMAGLSNLLSDLGSGLSDFFTIISGHADAGGTVFTALGSALSAILPILGQLIGAGAELGASILPPVAAALHGIGAALNFVAPVLPAVIGGIVALKAASAAAAALAGLNQALTLASYSGGRFAPLMGAASSALTGLRTMLPTIALATVAVGIAFEKQSEQVDAWGKALLDGGHAADQARQELSKYKQFTDVFDSGSIGFIGHLTGYGAALDVTAQNTKKAEQAARDYYNSLSPLGQAQQDATKAENEYLDALDKYGPASGQAAGAAVAYRDASQRAKDVQDQLNIAIHGVTQAMIDQADEALAAIDSNFALQHAQNQQRDAEIALADAIKQHGSASTEAHDAEQSYVESIYNTAKAAAQLKADQSGLQQGTIEYKNVLDTQLLKSLQQVESTLTGPEKAAVDGFIKQLEAAGVTSDGVGGKLNNLGQKKPTPQARLDDSQFNTIYSYVTGAINTLHGKRPTPTAFMNTQPFGGAAASMNGMLAYLNSIHVRPSASLIAYTLAAEQQMDYAARNRRSYVTQYVSTFRIGAAASGGKIADVIGQRYDVGGKIRGPGGPTDDMVQAIAGNSPLRVSPDEWVIKGSSSAKYGDFKMAAINAGVADVTVPQRAMAGGGPAAIGSGSSSGTAERPIFVNLSFPGMLGAPNPADLRKAAVILRDEIRKVERASR